MKVTPIKKKFGRYEVGTVFELPDRAARIFIKAKKLEQVSDAPTAPTAPTYQTRMMTAEQAASAPAVAARATVSHAKPAADVDQAPYGYKADGTPRKRPAPAPRKASE